MTRRRYVGFGAALLAFALLAAGAQAATYSIDPVHSNVEFSIRHLVSRVSGWFTGVAGSIDYDPEHLEQSSVTASIDVTTVDTHNERRNNDLKSPHFFDAERYPAITFNSTSVAKKGDRLMVTGDLTMHGVARQVVLLVEVLGLGTHPRSKAPVAGFAAETVLKRSDFGVNNWADPAGVLGDEVTVRLSIEATGKKDEGEGEMKEKPEEK